MAAPTSRGPNYTGSHRPGRIEPKESSIAEVYEVAKRVSEEVCVKDTNPKDACGIKKAPISTVSGPVLLEIGVAMLEGALKYGRHNYRESGVRASVYIDAVVGRHLNAWQEGENDDPESGLSHLTKAAAGLIVLRDAQIRGKMVDDRPRGTKGFVEHLNKIAAALIEKYPEPKEAFIADGRPQDEYQP